LAAFNAHDHAALRECYDPGARTRRPGWPSEAGVDELLESIMDVAAILDLHLEIVSRTAESGSDATEVAMTGTSTGPLVLGDLGKALFGAGTEELPGTGRPVVLTAVILQEVHDGRITAERHYLELLE